MSRATSIIALTLAATVATSPVVARTGPTGPARWVHTWTSTPVHTSIGGRKVRLRFSNAFGGAVLPLTAARENVTVTAHLADGQASNAITSHPGSRTTSHLFAGDDADADDLPGATPTNHWYFLSGVEVLSRRQRWPSSATR